MYNVLKIDLTKERVRNILEKQIKKQEEKTKKIKPEQKKKIIIYVLLVVAVLYIAYTIYLLIKQPTNVFTIEEGTLYQEETDIGYVIRNETVVRGNNYKNGMEQIKTEGQRASKDENIFRYYSTNEESLKQKIAELDTKIQEAMAQDTGIFTADMKSLEDQIDEKLKEINEITDVATLTEYKKEIDNLITRKAKIAGDLSPKGSYLNELIEERKQYESSLNSGAEYVKVPMSGIVSYKVDGLEETLTPDNFGSINKEFLEELNLQTGKIVATSDEAGKIIDNFCCYIATISSSEEAKQAEVGDSVKVRLSNNAEVPAKINSISYEENGEVLLILQLNEQIEELTNYRKISFDLIWWDATGLKVPNQAIVEQDGLKYVVRSRAGYLNKILVNVTRQGDKYSIVTAYTTDELKELGFTSEEINTYKKISIYDEIILNPDMSKVE